MGLSRYFSYIDFDSRYTGMDRAVQSSFSEKFYEHKASCIYNTLYNPSQLHCLSLFDTN